MPWSFPSGSSGNAVSSVSSPIWNSMPVRSAERVIKVRRLDPGVLAPLAFGAFEPPEEIVEVRMRTSREAAPAFRLTLHECDLHGVRSDCDGCCVRNELGPLPVRPMAQTQQTRKNQSTTPRQSKPGRRHDVLP